MPSGSTESEGRKRFVTSSAAGSRHRYLHYPHEEKHVGKYVVKNTFCCPEAKFLTTPLGDKFYPQGWDWTPGIKLAPWDDVIPHGWRPFAVESVHPCGWAIPLGANFTPGGKPYFVKWREVLLTSICNGVPLMAYNSNKWESFGRKKCYDCLWKVSSPQKTLPHPLTKWSA
jgi:hypothetical protein